MQIELDIRIRGQHVSVESFIGIYKHVRTKIVHSIYDVVKADLPEVKNVPNDQLKKAVQDLFRFEIKEAKKGSFEIIAISIPILFFVGRLAEKIAFDILKDNPDYEAFKSRVNESLSKKIFKRTEEKLKSDKEFQKIQVDYFEAEGDKRKLIRIKLEYNKRPELPSASSEEEAEEYVSNLLEKIKKNDESKDS